MASVSHLLCCSSSSELAVSKSISRVLKRALLAICGLTTCGLTGGVRRGMKGAPSGSASTCSVDPRVRLLIDSRFWLVGIRADQSRAVIAQIRLVTGSWRLLLGVSRDSGAGATANL